MITFSKLGILGQLGNQMFQYATILSVAKHKQVKFGISDNTAKIRQFQNLSCQIMQDDSEIQHVFHQNGFHYNEKIFDIDDNTDVIGFFQSPKYFQAHREQLKSEFRFNPQTFEDSRQLINKPNICAVHVRGGDYLTKSAYHYTCSTRYYENAIAKMKERGFTHFFVFSDDLEWAKTRINNAPNITFIQTSVFQDMCMMTLCDGHIIANSSYSWWGAYLSDSKFVIAPKTWFGPKGPQNWHDIYCDSWQLMDNS